MPAYGLLSGLGQGLTSVADTYQQTVAQDKQFSNAQSLEELRAQKSREIEELRQKHQMNQQAQEQEFKAGEAEKTRGFEAEQGAAERASREEIAETKQSIRGKNPEKERADIEYRQQQVMDKKDEQAARVLGVEDFALGMQFKKKPTEQQVKQLKRIYGDDLQIVKDDGGWFGKTKYAADRGGGGAKNGGLPPGVTEADIEFTMKKHGVSREEVLNRLQGK